MCDLNGVPMSTVAPVKREVGVLSLVVVQFEFDMYEDFGL